MTDEYKHNDPRLRPPPPSSYPWTPIPSPESKSAKVSISVLDSSQLTGPGTALSSFAREDEKWLLPAFSFLVEHGDEAILFDLGCREDPENFTPVTKPALKEFIVTPHPHPVSRLQEGKYDLNRIKTVIISHKHFDHFGNLDTISSFDPLIVLGPGSMKVIGKGYPETENSPWPSSWLKDHRIFELPSSGQEEDWKIDGKGEPKSWGKVACFEEGIDWFGDGSFWLINAPGHCAGQIMGLARVTTAPDTYILLGADAAHSQETYLPVPDSSYDKDPRGTEPVIDGKVPFLEDPEGGVHDIGALTRMSAEDNIMVVLAHEAPAAEILPRWPETIDEWKEKGLKDIKEAGVRERAKQRGTEK